MFSFLKGKKNLLAFSAGTDSSALYHMLTSSGIDFDLIMVDYGVRKEAKKEVEFAKKLNKKLFLYKVEENLKTSSNFEKKARDIRYAFFDKVMVEKGYDNLILGHNLSDKVEWFLMRFINGSGIRELYGMDYVSYRKNYKIIRPLLNLTKTEIMEYLNQNNITYFFDKSNLDEKYKRNYFRHNFSEKLISQNPKGVLKTFKILKKEIELLPKEELVEQKEKFFKFKVDFEVAGQLLSKLLKKEGYLLSGGQRKEFEELEEVTVKIENTYFTGTYQNGYLYFSPFIKNISMPKKFKEKMRVDKIPPKHRGYLYSLVVG